MTTLGRFQLIKPIASGGMATVWHAVHVDRGLPAAVKLLSHRVDPSLIRALRAEIEAMARLDHPHIVGVYGQGEVSEEAATEASHLRAGTPWVALEYVSGPTLLQHHKELNWESTHTALRQLLSALAHAHARGVIHRDLKLANLLLGPDGLKLTDFGIAYALRQHENGDINTVMHAGTPRYMAPEQLRERVADLGPWTDLYGLGILAWRLTSRTAPFPKGESGEALKRTGCLQPFTPRFDVPNGFASWCSRLLHPHPDQRFGRAADALAALNALGHGLGRQRVERADLNKAPLTLAPMPATWRDAPQARRRTTQLGGLNLFGLRRAPFIGRESARDRLWSDLQTVRQTGQPRAVILRGKAGVGKTRLATWLQETAEEQGAATQLSTRWSDPSRSGLAGLVARRLRCLTADEATVRMHIGQHLRAQKDVPAGEAHRLLSLLVPTTEDSEPLTADDRDSLVRRVLERATRTRPAVVAFDDAHVNPEAFTFIERLLHTPSLPVLFVLTVQEEALAERPASVIALERLCTRIHAHSLVVGPLGASEQGAMIRSLLPVEPTLADRLVRRAAGSPLFARQLLDDWVQRDMLTLMPDGYRLRGDDFPDLPDDLHQVWRARIDSLVEGNSSWMRPLQLAAALGHRMREREWTLACAEAGLHRPSGLVSALRRHRLLVNDGSDWRFVHGMLRDTLLDESARSGHLHLDHAAIARALTLLKRSAVRIGHHLLHARVGFEAIDPLQQAALEATRSGDYHEALRLLQARSKLMQDLEVDPADVRWGHGRLATAELLARLDRWDEAAHFAKHAQQDAAHNGWPRVEVESIMLLVENRAHTDLGRAQDLLERAHTIASRPEHADTRAQVGLLAAQVHRRSGNLTGSLLHARRALAHVLTHGGVRRTRCEIELCQTLLKLGQLADAALHARRAEILAKGEDHPFDLAVCAYLRARIGRAQGELDSAEQGYRDATDRFAGLGDPNAWTMRAHLGIVLAERGKHDEALALFQLVLRSSSQLGDLLAHLGSLLCTADRADALGFRRHVQAVERFVQRGWCDPLAASIAENAADRAASAGYPSRARVLLGLSHRQRERLASA